MTVNSPHAVRYNSILPADPWLHCPSGGCDFGHRLGNERPKLPQLLESWQYADAFQHRMCERCNCHCTAEAVRLG